MFHYLCWELLDSYWYINKKNIGKDDSFSPIELPPDFFFLAMLCGFRDLSSPGRIESRPWQWKCQFLTIGPLGNSWPDVFKRNISFFVCVVDPWTVQVWTAWSSFAPVALRGLRRAESWLWIQGYRGPTIGYSWCGGSAPLMPLLFNGQLSILDCRLTNGTPNSSS